ncbi:MAG: phosphoglycerate dehydrogenase [Magnetovibrio sp.]|nr:phosphoglycerate dehydrogenase [Magnetovibrio sp.]
MNHADHDRPRRIAVTSRSFSRNSELRAALQVRFSDSKITFNDDGHTLFGAALIAFLKGHDHAITALERLDAAVFDALPELEVVSKFGVGIDMIDIAAMNARHIRLGWRKGVNKRAVSELAIACMIALLRHVPTANAQVQSGNWQQITGRQLTGKTVGIVGCGHVGRDLSGLLGAFDCHILAHDIEDFADFCAQSGVEAVGLANLMREADIVSLHLPLDKSTRNILDGDMLALMKPDALLLNMARGGLVDEEALKAALDDGRLAGAALDVFAEEPPSNLALARHPRMLALPHIGGSAEEAIVAMGLAAIDGLEDAAVPELGVR